MTYDERDQLVLDYGAYVRKVNANPIDANHDELLEIAGRLYEVLIDASIAGGD